MVPSHRPRIIRANNQPARTMPSIPTFQVVTEVHAPTKFAQTHSWRNKELVHFTAMYTYTRVPAPLFFFSFLKED
jgi:hypothetical protein